MLDYRRVGPAGLVVGSACCDHRVSQLSRSLAAPSEGLVENDLLGPGLDGLVADGLNLGLGVMLEAVD